MAEKTSYWKIVVAGIVGAVAGGLLLDWARKVRDQHLAPKDAE